MARPVASVSTVLVAGDPVGGVTVKRTDAPDTGVESVLNTVTAIGTVEFFGYVPSGASAVTMGGNAGATVHSAAPVPECVPSVLVATASTAWVPSEVPAGTVFVIETEPVAVGASVIDAGENDVPHPAGEDEESVKVRLAQAGESLLVTEMV